MTLFQILILSISSIITLIAIYLSIYFYRKQNHLHIEYQNLARQNEKYKTLLLNQGLEQMQVELNPHLFKNILNTIQSYAYKTHITLEHLGNLFDYILYDSRNKLISIKDDIEFVKSFVELNKLRLSPLFNIRLKLDIDEDDHFFNKQVIVPLATVHLIENAFKHGILDNNNGFITIFLNLRNGIYFCHVLNKINKSEEIKTKGGFGKENLHKRLKLVYNDRYELHYSIENEIYSASLKIMVNES
jgi:LytS/YehU family sensor histidine kinase